MSGRVSLEEIRKVAQLAKLSFPEEELVRFFQDISDIIAHFEKLSELDLDHVSPTSHISWSQPPVNPDEPVHWQGSDLVLEHAPCVVGRYFVVPKVVEKEERPL
ncbi:MAG: Asp-tRNA(Asn)/Glu-tRNA(Gln) amidotransferase subunit GatC [Candidatus Caldatribacterium sp.]|uniref:Asp-tRNA(Asn)/Glu-tRNA(Gln) amidotransferase subunit GatC n=1 Tax=Candidatus Caldatribacterium sp. TaxID=2282143 RepID=UPI002991B589|nr:Asp-tRNA(Asn)/Glu-tRNA(Gln) amidotransferase subunit GatC [Candidatus Caldatribacterium sp.]MCX7730263.1 Asp-tRNA(Asn)/Glu-tRNA(Gln) amidotransferase subunit GatC [Candidatus Caldatribacterium sp.]MDW8080890.1 Asp-tRNA(Asn)/Glu-tRNA(Gln) amidotransferase subunit GatC [Candidatus Calescibacterium sp.]